MLIAAGDEQQLEICIALPYVAHDNAHFNHLFFKVMLQCISKGSVFLLSLILFASFFFFFKSVCCVWGFGLFIIDLCVLASFVLSWKNNCPVISILINMHMSLSVGYTLGLADSAIIKNWWTSCNLGREDSCNMKTAGIWWLWINSVRVLLIGWRDALMC